MNKTLLGIAVFHYKILQVIFMPCITLLHGFSKMCALKIIRQLFVDVFKIEY